jgi:hypothetical protein
VASGEEEEGIHAASGEREEEGDVVVEWWEIIGLGGVHRLFASTLGATFTGLPLISCRSLAKHNLPFSLESVSKKATLDGSVNKAAYMHIHRYLCLTTERKTTTPTWSIHFAQFSAAAERSRPERRKTECLPRTHRVLCSQQICGIAQKLVGS